MVLLSLHMSKKLEKTIHNHIYEYENVVIGSRLNAVMYAFLNNCPIFLNKHEPPLPFELFPQHTSLNAFGVCGTVISLVTPDGVEKFGNPKSELWKRLCYSLSLSGLMPLANNACRMRIEGNILKVYISNTKTIRIRYSQLHIFDGDNIEGLVEYPDNKTYQVVDWINVRSGMVHDYDRIKTTSSFVNCVHFYPSERIEGNHNKKDLVAISYLTREQLNDINYSDTYVRFKVRDVMKGAGIRGKRNGKNPNYPHSSQTPYKHASLNLENSRREIRVYTSGSYEKLENVFFKSYAEEDLCDGKVKESRVYTINDKITKKDLLIR